MHAVELELSSTGTEHRVLAEDLPPTFAGWLEVTPFAELLTDLSIMLLSGTLLIFSDEEDRELDEPILVVLSSGIPVAAQKGSNHDSLIESLLGLFPRRGSFAFHEDVDLSVPEQCVTGIVDPEQLIMLWARDAPFEDLAAVVPLTIDEVTALSLPLGGPKCELGFWPGAERCVALLRQSPMSLASLASGPIDRDEVQRLVMALYLLRRLEAAVTLDADSTSVTPLWVLENAPTQCATRLPQQRLALVPEAATLKTEDTAVASIEMILDGGPTRQRPPVPPAPDALRRSQKSSRVRRLTPRLPDEESWTQITGPVEIDVSRFDAPEPCEEPHPFMALFEDGMVEKPLQPSSVEPKLEILASRGAMVHLVRSDAQEPETRPSQTVSVAAAVVPAVESAFDSIVPDMLVLVEAPGAEHVTPLPWDQPEPPRFYTSLDESILTEQECMAEAACDSAVVVDPSSAEGLYQSGLALARQGDVNGSVQCFHRAMMMDRSHAGALAALRGRL